MSKKDVMTQGGNSKQGALKHRRLSSTGQARRRMSDARDAAASVGLRPGCVHIPFSSFSFFSFFAAFLFLSLPKNFSFSLMRTFVLLVRSHNYLGFQTSPSYIILYSLPTLLLITCGLPKKTSH